MIHIARYLLLRKDELGVGDIIARRIPQAAPFLRLWDTFQIISRRRHRQALRRGTGPKDVSFLISIIVRVGPHFRLLLPTSGQTRNSRKIHSKIPRRYAHDTPRRPTTLRQVLSPRSHRHHTCRCAGCIERTML